MGIIERKERERNEMRSLILQEAMKLFQERGFDNTSMRAIADRIEYSPTTLYLYFKDKTELFHALHTKAFELLAEGFEPLRSIADPFERLIVQGREYIRFAVDNPALYDLMFNQPIADEYLVQHERKWEEGDNAFAALKFNVSQCIDAGYFPPEDIETFSYFIWSSLHGMITLQMRPRCCDMISPEKREELLNYAYQHFVSTLHAMRSLVPNKAV